MNGVIHLHNEGDEHGQHREREAEDVEERQSHKCLIGSEPVVRVVRVFVDQHKSSKGGQGNLNTGQRSLNPSNIYNDGILFV